MVSLTSPRTSGALAVIIMFSYVYLLTQGLDELLNQDILLIFLLTIGSFIGISAFSFATNELKQTQGVLNIFDLGMGRFFGTVLFSFFIAIGYDALVLILIEVFKSNDQVALEATMQYSELLVTTIVGFLIIYPFFQFHFLAQKGEDSSIPSEYYIEIIMEWLTTIVRSPFIAAVFAYIVAYVIPVFFFIALGFETVSALVLVAVILPLISLGALAGAGFGEDLIRLKMIRNPVRDLKKLGMPKVNLRKLEFDFGGFLLVIIAIQAIITSFIFGIISLVQAFGYRQSAPLFSAGILFLTLFNKGRGSMKEMKEVWQEGGFKVQIFQLFLPVFVLLGVIMSSALEVFVQQSEAEGVLGELGLSDHTKILATVLVLQNFVIIFSALIIWKNPPGTAERRLIKEVPKFYGDDIDGYIFIYNRLQSEDSVKNLLAEMSKRFKKDPSQAKILLPILKQSLVEGQDKVQIAAADTLMTIIQRSKKFDEEYYELTKIALESDVVGARIFAVRAMREIMKQMEGEEKEAAITLLQTKISDEDAVISWDASITLQHLTKDEPEYRSYILALMIKTLSQTSHKGSIDAITRFMNKIASESSEIGKMAISLLGIQLSQGETKYPENVISAIRAIIRGNSMLATDLIDIVATGIHDSDENTRKQSYLVLANLAQYGSGQEDEILQLILNGLNDESEEIQVLAYDALAKDVVNHTELLEDIYTMLASTFSELRGRPLLAALRVLNVITSHFPDLHTTIFDLIKNAAKSSTASVRAAVFEIFASVATKNAHLAEEIYLIVENNIDHEDEKVRTETINTMGMAVSANHSLARAVYRRVTNARNDNSLRVQLAAIEALGHVASANKAVSDEIYGSLIPLLQDDDWQVRLAALNGLHAATHNQRKLVDESVKHTGFALTDTDRTIRNVALDFLVEVIDQSRSATDEMISIISKELKRQLNDVKATLYHALEIIIQRRPQTASTILSFISTDFDNPVTEVRIAVHDALNAATGAITKAHEGGKEITKSINKIISNIQRAANHSNPGIRRTAYECLTTICVNLPNFKVSDRGRTAITTSIKHEKDVGLQEFLETCRIRSRKPLDLRAI